MISKSNIKSICRNREQIENYDKAVNDKTQMYDIHHRLQSHFSDGTLRDVFISKDELIALGMYWHRPPEELIFLSEKEHSLLHGKCKLHRYKLHKAKYKGGRQHKKPTKHWEKCWKQYTKLYENLTYKYYEPERRSHGQKGKKFSNEARQKMSFAKKDKPGRPQTDYEKAKRKETFRLCKEAYKIDNKGLSWNDFQKYYKNNRRK